MLLDEWVPVAAAAVGGLIALGATWIQGRREWRYRLRDERRAAYVDFLNRARRLTRAMDEVAFSHDRASPEAGGRYPLEIDRRADLLGRAAQIAQEIRTAAQLADKMTLADEANGLVRQVEGERTFVTAVEEAIRAKEAAWESYSTLWFVAPSHISGRASEVVRVRMPSPNASADEWRAAAGEMMDLRLRMEQDMRVDLGYVGRSTIVRYLLARQSRRQKERG